MTCRPEKQLDSIRAYSKNDDGALSVCQFNRRAYTWPWECRPVVMNPQDTIEHTHLRDPEKRVRRYVEEEIASDGKWRKKQLTAKEKNIRCQLECQAIRVARAGRGRPGYTKALGKCRRRKKEIGPKTVKLCRCGQMLHVQTNGASADKWQDGKNVACADKCCR